MPRRRLRDHRHGVRGVVTVLVRRVDGRGRLGCSGGLERGDEGVADVACDGARQCVFLRKYSVTLGVKPHIVRYLQLAHAARAIWKL